MKLLVCSGGSVPPIHYQDKKPMKRPFLFVIVALLTAFALLPLVDLRAAPVQQEARPVIAQPAPDTAVRGVVQIVGTATHPQFQRYELYYAPWPIPSDQSWIFIGDAHFTQQPLGLLGTWDSRSVPDGTYALRVRVVKVDGNYLDSDPQRVLVANTRPLPSPTPDATDTPAPIPTPAPPTPTIVIQAPEVAETATPEPTPTPEPESTPLLAGSTSAGAEQTQPAAGGLTDQLFSGQRLLAVAEQAAVYTLAAFAVIGAFFAVKALLAWLWHKIRP